jgi:DNA polymerase III alpha subunit
MKEQERLHILCQAALEQKGLANDERYVNRLKWELKEIDAQGEHEYLLGLQKKFLAENLIFPYNEHNNLVDWLLGLAPSVDIEKPGAFIQGEFPDIDIDYLKEARDYLKRTWAREKFGQEYICEIGTYGTIGIKSAILDMARVHGAPKDEIQAITVKMIDKDDEGNELEWDKALEIYPEFKAYCERYPDVADAAKKLLGRNKTAGVHAGGLIISSERIDGFVPLEVRMVNKENPNGVICSAWTEGLNRQDLGPVGLIKFDLLVINNLLQIALACKLIKERHGITTICAREGDWDWSDISYLNDPKAIAMANKGDLKCIFQFDSEGIRKLVKKGGVSSFDDLAIYSALYRPGPLNMGMDVRYTKRKRGEEPFSIHPVMEPYLKKTYGVLVFQEQIMDILRVVGLIPDMHTEKVRKAISKKKIKDFIKYKEQFIDNGSVVLNVNPEYCIDLWNQIESFAEYGFNASHAYAYAYISARLLWLKAHYPLEFYTAIMMCENDDVKFRDYKLDAKYHGIDINPVHINKSRVNFAINEDKIFFGFSNIKTIGEEVAKRIVENQPYKGFSDFLDRFGTDAAPIKALTALGVFEEPYDRVTLRKFSEWYKKQVGASKDRKKRFEASMDKKLEELRNLLLEEVKEDDPDFEKLCEFSDDAEKLWEERFSGIVRKVPYKYKGEERFREVTFCKLLQDLARKRKNSIENFYEKEKDDEETPITIDQFNPNLITLDEEEMEILTDQLVVDGVTTYPKAESIYYGFQWTHILECSPDYTGATIDKFLDEAENHGLQVGMIEVQIKQVQKRTSKGEKATEFYSITVEDANSKQIKVTVWMDDYNRFREEWRTGNLLKIRVRPPVGGFNTLTFESVPRQQRKYLPPKEEDYRVRVMRLPEQPKSEKKESILDELKFDPSAIDGLDF